MIENSLILKLLLAIIFGAILGLESETRDVEPKGEKVAKEEEKSKIGGLRTYTVISLLGGISGILYSSGSYILSYILLGSIILFVLIAYILNVQIKKAFGITTEIAILITFIIGFLTTSSLVDVSIILAILVLLTFFLSQKRGLGAFISKIEHREIIDFMKFGLVSLVILPLFPNSDYSILQILKAFAPSIELSPGILTQPLLNPFQLWFTVVIISGISLFTYSLSKFIGSKSSLLHSGILGGFISSTSTIAVLNTSSKKHSDDRMQLLLSSVGIISNAFSVVTLAILILINSKVLIKEIFPILSVFLVSGFSIGIILFILSNRGDSKNNIKLNYQPFSIVPAIKFVALILIVRLFVQFLTSVNADANMLVLLTSLSGLAGIDAPSVAFAGLFQSNQLALDPTILAIVLTLFINTFGKAVYSFFAGNRKFAIYLTTGLMATFFFGLAAILF